MNGVNQCTFVGHVGSQPEYKMTPGGQSVLNFSIAVNESWIDSGSGQRREKVEWIRIAAWAQQADGLSKFLSKGMLVAVQGRMQTREYEKNGEKRYATDIRADRVHVLTPKGDGAARAPAVERTSGPAGVQQALDRAGPPAQQQQHQQERRPDPVGSSLTSQGAYAPPAAPAMDDYAGYGTEDDEIPF